MNQQEVLELFNKVGAVITDSHIVYTSGHHGEIYFNKDAIYPYTDITSDFCESIALHFAETKKDIDVVIAPALGGIILSQWTAYHLSKMVGHKVLGVYAEKAGDTFVIKRGYDKLVTGRNVLVMEDVLTTGGSVKNVIEVTRSIGGNVIGVGVLCNRGGVKSEDIGNVPEIYALTTVNAITYPEDDCPLCKKNVPINISIGKGREFLARQTAQ